MNDTFQEFVNFLRINREKIRDDLLMPDDSPRRHLYSEVFVENYIRNPVTGSFGKDISATDSTEFVRELYNGKKVILIRSYTTAGQDIFSSFLPLVISVGRDDLQRFLTMLMEHSEHLSILKMLEERHPDYILVDGSISGRLNRQSRQILAEGYEAFHEEYMATLSRMINRATNLDIPLLFIAKSSESRAFKEYLLSEIAKKEGDLPIIKEERQSRVNDHYLIKSLADEPGYSKPVKQKAKLHTIEGDFEYHYLTTHIMPDAKDLPLKMDVIGENDKIGEDIISLAFWGYGDVKVHNIWLANVDRMVKFRNDEVENIYMRTFEREIGISLYETRGERRARIRI